MSFDEHSADYSQKIDRALTVVGLEHGFFFEAKVQQILEARRRLAAHGADGAVRVLEIGCGIGLLTQRLRPLLTAVWGMDPSISSLGQADGLDGRLIAADGLHTPFADESFDLVIAVCVLHHVPVDRRAAFLAEAARITRRGGLVLLCEHNPWNPLTRLVVGRCESSPRRSPPGAARSQAPADRRRPLQHPLPLHSLLSLARSRLALARIAARLASSRRPVCDRGRADVTLDRRKLQNKKEVSP